MSIVLLICTIEATDSGDGAPKICRIVVYVIGFSTIQLTAIDGGRFRSTIMTINPNMSKPPTYVATEREAKEAIDEIGNYKVAGVDTEFFGVEVGSESCVGRSICHVFSVATPSGPLLPRGFNEAKSWVFAGALLSAPNVKEWLEDESFLKAIHNQPVDDHTLRNSGVIVRGARNTLAMARFWWPHRAKFEGFDLDSLGQDYCGVGKTESFDGLLGYDAIEVREHEVTKKRCACGVLSCRLRKPPHDVKTEERVIAPFNAKVRRFISLTTLNSAHDLWPRYLAYAAWDAVLALWIYQLMMREASKERPYPWRIPI